jgi:hypothetical protein
VQTFEAIFVLASLYLRHAGKLTCVNLARQGREQSGKRRKENLRKINGYFLETEILSVDQIAIM